MSSGMEPKDSTELYNPLAAHFATLPDPRVVGRCDHDLLAILSIAIMSVICGCKGWEDMAFWAQDHQAWLKTFLRLPNGIPHHDCYRRVFAALDPTAFSQCFMTWMQALVGSTEGKLIAIDGKTMRRTFDRASGRSALHVVSAWVASNAVVLGQVVTDAKSNEITAIPALLALLDVRGAIVTIDAMGCQKDIAADIVARGADYVLSLKDNHPTAHQEVAEYFAWAISKGTVQSHQTTDGDHGRIEVRTTHVTTHVDWFEDRSDWKGLQSFVMVESERTIGSKVTTERRYYLSSLGTTDAAVVGAYVRAHWSIENTLHWSLDVTFREDDSRIRVGHGPQNLAWLRKLAITLLKRTPSNPRNLAKGRSLIQRQAQADRDHDYLLAVLTADSQDL